MKGLKFRFITWVIALVGFSACSAEVAAEYGTPHAEFEIKGKVTDMQQTPLKDIAVIYDDQFQGPDTLYTGSDGYFIIQGTMFPREKMKLIFKDLDGDSNGGLFGTKSVDVTMQQVEQGAGAWDYGRFVGAADVALENKEE